MPLHRSTILLAAVVAMVPAAALAQPAQVQAARPANPMWVAAGVGYFDIGTLVDDDGGEWNFDNTFQFRASVERSLRRDITVGIAGTYARIPFGVTNGTCHGCEGDGTIWQGLGSVRLGGGGGRIGFHSVLEGAVGFTAFTDFERRTDPSSLPGNPDPPSKSLVPTGHITYGAGYTINPGFEVNFVQDLGFIFHDNDRAGVQGGGTPRFGVSRLSLRYTLGGAR